MDEQQGGPASPAEGAGNRGEASDGARSVPATPAPRRSWLIAGGVALVVAGTAVGLALPHAGGAAHPTRPSLLVSKTGALAAGGAQITVTGSATVQGTPDTVSFSIGVHTVQPTATAALAANNAEMVRLQQALEGKGIAPSDLQTSSLDISENTSGGKVTGFSVDDDLNVTTHLVAEAGEAIDAAAGAVGNDVTLYGISFSISNESSLLASARAGAMANARTEAVQVAAGGGLSLGPIVKVVDEENSQPQYTFGADSVPAAAGALEIERGTQPVSVQVSVVYGLQG